ACLKRHACSRRASLEANRIAQNSFDARDVWQPGRSAGDGITIRINTDGRIAREASPAYCLIEQDARGRIHWRDDPRGNQRDIDPKLTERFDQCACSDIASTSAPEIPGNCCYELKQAHGWRALKGADPFPPNIKGIRKIFGPQHQSVLVL